jgi:hypothetical protein
LLIRVFETWPNNLTQLTRRRTTMKQTQVNKVSGQHHNVNLDNISLTALQACQTFHRDQSNNFSASIIVRRALRNYQESLQKLASLDMGQETIETLRAAKGVR